MAFKLYIDDDVAAKTQAGLEALNIFKLLKVQIESNELILNELRLLNMRVEEAFETQITHEDL